MTFITINWAPPQDPQLLIEEFSRLGWDSSSFRNVANAFHYNRGTTPSVGYFLMTKEDIPTGSVTLEIDTVHVFPGDKRGEFDDDPIQIKGLEVAEYKAINPIKNPDKGIYLVKIIDPIINRWSHTYVNQDFNIPIGSETVETSPGSPFLETKTIYDKSTVEGLLADTPYTWKSLFNVVSGETIDISEASFPTSNPEGFKFKNNADGRPTTRKQALNELLRITGHTIIRDPDKSLKLIAIDASFTESRLDAFSDTFLQFNSHIVKEKESIKLPKKVKFRFPRTAIGSALNQRYTEIVKTFDSKPDPDDNPLPTLEEVTWYINAPLYDNGENSAIQSELADHLFKVYKTAFKSLSPKLQQLKFSTYMNFVPDAGISQVIWSYTGSFPSTYISSDPGIEFPQSPEVVPHEILAKGIVTNSEEEENLEKKVFDVRQVELIEGNLDYVTFSGELIENVHRFSPLQTVEDGNKVIVFYNQSHGRYEAFRITDESDTIIFRFELIDPQKGKSGADATVLPTLFSDANARLLDDDGNPIQIEDPEDPDKQIDLLIHVVDKEERWFGLSEYESSDGLEDGYKGYALKYTDEFTSSEPGIPGAHIISMEGPAPFILVELNEDVDTSDTSGERPVSVRMAKEAPEFPISSYGSNLCHKLPEVESPGTKLFTAYDDHEFAKEAEAKQSEIWVAAFHQPAEVGPASNQSDRYFLIHRVESTKIERVMVATTKNGAEWDSGQALTPTKIEVWLLESLPPPNDRSYKATVVIQVEHNFVSKIEVSDGKGRIGLCMDRVLFNVDCEEVDFTIPT